MHSVPFAHPVINRWRLQRAACALALAAAVGSAHAQMDVTQNHDRIGTYNASTGAAVNPSLITGQINPRGLLLVAGLNIPTAVLVAQPVPEPSTWALFGAGALVVALRSRRLSRACFSVCRQATPRRRPRPSSRGLKRKPGKLPTLRRTTGSPAAPSCACACACACA